MAKRSAIYLAAVLYLAVGFYVVTGLGVGALGARAQTNTESSKSGPDTSKSWSGTIVYSSCNADEAFNESAECFRDAPGAKLALYDDTNRVTYSLEPQEKIAGHLGDTVTVRGTLDEDTIRVASIERLSIGLSVGQKAPAFSARDQLGHAQTLDTLRGPNGTVLLFFRSADW